ncbi:MAG TPA: arylamine N-acetyltransferase [Acidimicrobiales bacterium]|nr:arylamine N-acetyltransferase [Acidimicrobiales bacterium]
MTRADGGLDPEVCDAYLLRLGLERETPSAEALVRLHARHVERIPYETMWIHSGDRWGVDAIASARRVSLEGRGGYCFHLNGAFGELLTTLGYSVTRHVGGVHGPDGPSVDALTNHLVLTVAGLPTDTNPVGSWYVDVGLGDALHEAVPLEAGEFTQGPFLLSLEATHDGVGDWHLTHDPKGTFPGMSWRMSAATMTDFANRNVVLSTSPESGFVRISSAQRRDATGVDIMRGLFLTRVGEGTAPSDALTGRDDWFGALADIFDLTFDGVDSAVLDRLWSNVRTAHDAWLEAEAAQ